jgi:N-acetylglucosaminyldiphosphoundecaprenol N-acetyl-beta-D-mannosaminyltransferase
VSGAATAPAGVERHSPHGRANVLGCEIDRVDMDAAVVICEESVRSRRQVQHVAINAAKLVALQSDPELHNVVQGCELVTADGQAVVWASRVLGDPLPCRVAGIDLMHRLFASAERDGRSVYILGAKTEVLEEAIRRIRTQHPRLKIAGYRHGYFDDSEARSVAEAIEATKPDMLFVAISSPRKENFIRSYRDVLNVPFVMGVGGAIDVMAGVTRRAPMPMQRLGLEWLYRLRQEPRRLLRRYLTTNFAFIGLTVRTALRTRLVRSRVTRQSET